MPNRNDKVLKYTGERNLHPQIYADHKTVARKAARDIADAIIKAQEENRSFNLGLATGMTMEPVYDELIRLHKEEDLSFGNVNFYNLDNYIFEKGNVGEGVTIEKHGSAPDYRNSYAKQLRELFLDHIDAREKNIHLVGDRDFDPEEYEKKIEAAGGIDIQLLGLGGEGHIGFNEKGSKFDSTFREVELCERTRADNAGFFSKKGETIPTHAWTRGISDILKAKRLIVLANGESKAWAIRNMMDPSGKANEDFSSLELRKIIQLQGSEEPKIPDGIDENTFTKPGVGERNRHAKAVQELPARALHAHSKVDFLIDEKAASMMRISDLVQYSSLDKEQIESLVDKFTPKPLTLTINNEKKTIWLSPNFDFYDPDSMELNEEFDPFNSNNPNREKQIEALEKYLSTATATYTGAHQDDAEIWAGPMMMASKGDNSQQWLNIIMTDGAATTSSLDHSKFKDGKKLSPEEIAAIRKQEQREAAKKSGIPVIQLGYPSAAINGYMGVGKSAEVAHTLGLLFEAMPKMKTAYGHNPLDKHHTHVGTFACWSSALHHYKNNVEKIYGMEGWRGLNSFHDNLLVKFLVELQGYLSAIKDWISVFESQIWLQGRQYDAAGIAQLTANGAFISSPHSKEPPAGMALAFDLTDYVKNEQNKLWQPVEVAGDLLRKNAELIKKHAAKFTAPPMGDGVASGNWASVVRVRGGKRNPSTSM